MDPRLIKKFQEKPYLVWDVKNAQELSEKSVVEHIISNGDWDDFKELLAIFGEQKTADLFFQTIESQRTNYRPQTINFFKLYFKKYAPGSIESKAD